MRQLGLIQLVSPPFNMPITRRERTFRHVINYRKKMDKEVEALWDARSELGLHGAEDTTTQHSKEYLWWFGGKTVLFIGREQHAEQPAVAGQDDESDVPTAPDVLIISNVASTPDVPTAPTVPQKHVRYNITF